MNIIVSNFGTGYFLRSGEEFIKFWDKYFKKDEKKTLFILGLGFDPRALKCLEIILDKSQTSTVNCMVIQYDDNFQNREPMSTSLQTNITKLESLIPRDQWISKTIHMMSGTDYVGSVEAAQIIEKEDCNGYTDIILDISSMPNGIYFPIVRKLLDWIKTKEIKLNNDKKVNFHLVVSENAYLDGMIKDVGINETVTYMHKFVGTLQSEATKNLRKVWIPLLGEKQGNQLSKINDEIAPKEICPIFPIPSKDPYRNKKLLLEHREFLFDTLDIDVRSFIYANEQNPFETYRQIYETAQHYYHSFSALGGCHVVISPLSSKLLCVGALLAAYDLQSEGSNVGIAHVENQTYDIENVKDLEKEAKLALPFTMWLTGECYNE